MPSLMTYVSDVRTHAPIMYMFPPRATTQPRPTYTQVNSDDADSDLESDSELLSPSLTAHGPRQPSTLKASVSDGGHIRRSRPTLHRLHSENITARPSSSSEMALTPTSSTFIKGRDILGQMQSYVVLDEARAPHIGPNHTRSPTQTKSSLVFPDGHSVSQSPISRSTSLSSRLHADPLPSSSSSNVSSISGLSLQAAEQEAYDRAAFRVNRLPNRHLDMDLKTLHLHLSIRVTEILACAEAMWTWVVEFQAAEKAKTLRRRDRDRTIGQWDAQREREAASTMSLGDVKEEAGRDLKSEVLRMSRADFDVLLSYFEM